ncbi:death domain-containing protein [Endozoicomonas sp. 4G]|uniref:death domain-containing protein n=1 Tax=Endozoicomonas sp. 4G TaxID=2872754 RepID=UPI002078621C|nr:death domain-containing protein [Endozoicomonas sp. 4G]
MKAVRLLPKTHLFLLFILSVIFPIAGYSDAYTNLLSWAGWGISSKAIQTPGEISKLSFRGTHPPLHLTYGLNTADQSSKTISELGNDQFYIIQNGQPGELFNVCFRTPPALWAGNLPSPPVITKPAGQGMPEIQDGGVKLVPLAPDSGRWQYQYSARWRLPTGHQSLLLTVEDNNNGWVIEPQCSGIVSESTASPSSLSRNTSDNKNRSSVDIFFRNTQAENNPDDNGRFSGPLGIPDAPVAADNSEPFPSYGGGGFGGSDDLDFKKRPGGGRAPLYAFEWMSELFSRIILVPVPGTDGQTVQKQIWDTRIVLNIKQGWNEQSIIISQELWNKIRAARLERSTGLFLALSGNPDNPEAVFDHYLSNNPPQPLQTEDYQGYEQQVLILNPKQLRSVSVFPGHCPTGVGCSGGTSEVEKQMANLKPPSYTESQAQKYGRQYSGGYGGGKKSGEDDGSGGAPKKGVCQSCKNPYKTIYAFNMCQECLDLQSEMIEQEPTREPPPEIKRGEAIPISVAKEVDTSAVTICQWFKHLREQAGNYFYLSEYYKLPQLYKLLTHSFLLDRDTLSKFHLKWLEFLRGNVGLYQLISVVGELAKSQDVKKHVEVARIIKALAFYRSEFENEDAHELFGNGLKDYLTSKNILPPNDSDQALYSGLDPRQKDELINFIYQIFKQTGDVLKEEMVPSQYKTMVMFNSLAREAFDKFRFGFPVINNEQLEVVAWGFAVNPNYSFVSLFNKAKLRDGPNRRTLQDLALTITGNPFETEKIRAMFTALAVIRSMFGERSKAIFPNQDALSQILVYEQPEFLRTFTITATRQLVEILRVSDPEQKDEFIRNMFLIFGTVPKELAGELTQQWNPGLGSEKQAVAQAAAHPQHKQSKRNNQGSSIIDNRLPDELLLDLADELSIHWKLFARNTGDLKKAVIDNIDADNNLVYDKAIEMLHRWQQVKGKVTFRDLLRVLEKSKFNGIRFSIIERYGL